MSITYLVKFVFGSILGCLLLSSSLSFADEITDDFHSRLAQRVKVNPETMVVQELSEVDENMRELEQHYLAEFREFLTDYEVKGVAYIPTNKFFELRDNKGVAFARTFFFRAERDGEFIGRIYFHVARRVDGWWFLSAWHSYMVQ